MEAIKPADAFICHASEDKDIFVRHLANTLIRISMNVFYDEYSIKPGDSLIGAIGSGLRTAKWFIVILSPNFFKKEMDRKGIVFCNIEVC